MGFALILIGGGLVFGGLLNLMKTHWWPVASDTADGKILRWMGAGMVATGAIASVVGFLLFVL